MTALSNLLLAIGTLLLTHACYSAHEHSSLAFESAPKATTSPGHAFSSHLISPSTPTLPLDISLEVLFSVFVICLALVLGAEALRPISWRVWAGSVERGAVNGAEGFKALDAGRRLGFLDIRSQRAEFAAWVRAGGKESKTTQ